LYAVNTGVIVAAIAAIARNAQPTRRRFVSMWISGRDWFRVST